jgi:hypothetical protein
MGMGNPFQCLTTGRLLIVCLSSWLTSCPPAAGTPNLLSSQVGCRNTSGSGGNPSSLAGIRKLCPFSFAEIPAILAKHRPLLTTGAESLTIVPTAA